MSSANTKKKTVGSTAAAVPKAANSQRWSKERAGTTIKFTDSETIARNGPGNVLGQSKCADQGSFVVTFQRSDCTKTGETLRGAHYVGLASDRFTDFNARFDVVRDSTDCVWAVQDRRDEDDMDHCVWPQGTDSPSIVPLNSEGRLFGHNEPVIISWDRKAGEMRVQRGLLDLGVAFKNLPKEGLLYPFAHFDSKFTSVLIEDQIVTNGSPNPTAKVTSLANPNPNVSRAGAALLHKWSDVRKGKDLQLLDGGAVAQGAEQNVMGAFEIQEKGSFVVMFRSKGCTKPGETLRGGHYVGLASLSFSAFESRYDVVRDATDDVWAVQDHRDEDDMDHCVLPPAAPLNAHGRIFGHEDKVTVSWDRTKREMRLSREGIDLGVAFRNLPMNGPLFPFVHIDSKSVSVRISGESKTVSVTKTPAPAKIIPVNRVIKVAADLPLACTWSPTKKGSNLILSANGNSAQGADQNVFGSEPLTQDKGSFAVVFRRTDCTLPGESLRGAHYLGLASEEFTEYNGRYDVVRDSTTCVWAVQDCHDDDDMDHCILGLGNKKALLNGCGRIFGHEERIVVSWDRLKGEMRLQRGPVDLGIAFKGIPKNTRIYPFVHLDSQRSSVEFVGAASRPMPAQLSPEAIEGSPPRKVFDVRGTNAPVWDTTRKGKDLNISGAGNNFIQGGSQNAFANITLPDKGQFVVTFRRSDCHKKGETLRGAHYVGLASDRFTDFNARFDVVRDSTDCVWAVQDRRDEDDMDHCVWPQTIPLNAHGRVFGHEERVMVTWDRSKAEMCVQREGTPLGVAFSCLPASGNLFPFVHLDSALSSAEITLTMSAGVSPPRGVANARSGGVSSISDSLRNRRLVPPKQQAATFEAGNSAQTQKDKGNQYMQLGNRFIARNKKAGVVLAPLGGAAQQPEKRPLPTLDLHTELVRLQEKVRQSSRRDKELFGTPRDLKEAEDMLAKVQLKIQLLDKLYHHPKV